MHLCKLIKNKNVNRNLQINYKQYLFRIGCEFQGSCSNGVCRADNIERDCNEEDRTNTDNDPQILRHLVFLILLLCSMFIVRKLFLSTLLTYCEININIL